MFSNNLLSVLSTLLSVTLIDIISQYYQMEIDKIVLLLSLIISKGKRGKETLVLFFRISKYLLIKL